MFSFFFVIVYYVPFEWKRICAGLLFLSVLLLEMQLLRDEKVGVRLTSLK
jgi:hypothetical protein